MTVDWELTAELISLASGAAFAWPVLRLNKSMQRAHEQETKAKETRSKYLRQLRQGLAGAYAAPEWNRADDILARLGLALMIIASGVRVWIHW